MKFWSFNDFFQKKEVIKEEYKTLSAEEIKIYKMYVYSTCFETEYGRDLMWEYLNSDDILEMSKLGAEWELRKRKKGRR